ncbi:gamma-glutamylcyclotransferase family protein [Deinococcus alpinitundrae]|uniref:gamma-glutamylcyclotransferase family protein n=1 Tax=Deinococcus alpinitundrae TaxID=468913 RepID=UPI001ED93F4B|nr:gamma-glutamylcyclotransferase [Deinococcus alpinitundrae]
MSSPFQSGAPSMDDSLSSEPLSSGPSELTSVFVYGTLMPGERWESVARQGGEYQAQMAQLGGVVLADLRPEGYPALFEEPQASSVVHGWLYTYTAASWPRALPFLDDLEGLHLSPPLYQRVRVSVQTADGLAPAWVYLYARPGRRQAPGFVPVVSGRWADVPERHLEGPRQTWETPEDEGGGPTSGLGA